VKSTEEDRKDNILWTPCRCAFTLESEVVPKLCEGSAARRVRHDAWVSKIGCDLGHLLSRLEAIGLPRYFERYS
jgi:hypothetical protein